MISLNLCNNGDQTWFCLSLTFTRSLGRCWKPRASPCLILILKDNHLAVLPTLLDNASTPCQNRQPFPQKPYENLLKIRIPETEVLKGTYTYVYVVGSTKLLLVSLFVITCDVRILVQINENRELLLWPRRSFFFFLNLWFHFWLVKSAYNLLIGFPTHFNVVSIGIDIISHIIPSMSTNICASYQASKY